MYNNNSSSAPNPQRYRPGPDINMLVSRIEEANSVSGAIMPNEAELLTGNDVFNDNIHIQGPRQRLLQHLKRLNSKNELLLKQQVEIDLIIHFYMSKIISSCSVVSKEGEVFSEGNKKTTKKTKSLFKRNKAGEQTKENLGEKQEKRRKIEEHKKQEEKDKEIYNLLREIREINLEIQKKLKEERFNSDEEKENYLTRQYKTMAEKFMELANYFEERTALREFYMARASELAETAPSVAKSNISELDPKSVSKYISREREKEAEPSSERFYSLDLVPEVEGKAKRKSFQKKNKDREGHKEKLSQPQLNEKQFSFEVALKKFKNALIAGGVGAAYEGADLLSLKSVGTENEKAEAIRQLIASKIKELNLHKDEVIEKRFLIAFYEAKLKLARKNNDHEAETEIQLRLAHFHAAIAVSSSHINQKNIEFNEGKAIVYFEAIEKNKELDDATKDKALEAHGKFLKALSIQYDYSNLRQESKMIEKLETYKNILLDRIDLANIKGDKKQRDALLQELYKLHYRLAGLKFRNKKLTDRAEISSEHLSLAELHHGIYADQTENQKPDLNAKEAYIKTNKQRSVKSAFLSLFKRQHNKNYFSLKQLKKTSTKPYFTIMLKSLKKRRNSLFSTTSATSINYKLVKYMIKFHNHANKLSANTDKAESIALMQAALSKELAGLHDKELKNIGELFSQRVVPIINTLAYATSIDEERHEKGRNKMQGAYYTMYGIVFATAQMVAEELIRRELTENIMGHCKTLMEVSGSQDAPKISLNPNITRAVAKSAAEIVDGELIPFSPILPWEKVPHTVTPVLTG